MVAGLLNRSGVVGAGILFGMLLPVDVRIFSKLAKNVSKKIFIGLEQICRLFSARCFVKPLKKSLHFFSSYSSWLPRSHSSTHRSLLFFSTFFASYKSHLLWFLRFYWYFGFPKSLIYYFVLRRILIFFLLFHDIWSWESRKKISKLCSGWHLPIFSPSFVWYPWSVLLSIFLFKWMPI